MHTFKHVETIFLFFLSGRQVGLKMLNYPRVTFTTCLQSYFHMSLLRSNKKGSKRDQRERKKKYLWLGPVIKKPKTDISFPTKTLWCLWISNWSIIINSLVIVKAVRNEALYDVSPTQQQTTATTTATTIKFATTSTLRVATLDSWHLRLNTNFKC